MRNQQDRRGGNTESRVDGTPAQRPFTPVTKDMSLESPSMPTLIIYDALLIKTTFKLVVVIEDLLVVRITVKQKSNQPAR